MTEEIKARITAFLTENEGEQKTLLIAKHLFGKDATCKMVNKHLYGMAKSGEIEKISEPDGSNPRWKLVPK